MVDLMICLKMQIMSEKVYHCVVCAPLSYAVHDGLFIANTYTCLIYSNTKQISNVQVQHLLWHIQHNSTNQV